MQIMIGQWTKFSSSPFRCDKLLFLLLASLAAFVSYDTRLFWIGEQHIYSLQLIFDFGLHLYLHLLLFFAVKCCHESISLPSVWWVTGQNGIMEVELYIISQNSFNLALKYICTIPLYDFLMTTTVVWLTSIGGHLDYYQRYTFTLEDIRR